ncbi:MAG TPA: metallophosphoesterase family protein [Thermoanaerobaculia bacterium]|nr:metallophosphoesterase family protein [Thermoanaerobaculia bacterium]
MRIGIISDTHGLLHPRVPDVFAGVDHILHAGDVGGAHVLEALREIAPVTAVAGNNDDADGYEIARFGDIVVTHILPRPSKPGKHVLDALKRKKADLVVFGHSHLPHNEVRDGIRFFNPASAGPRRFDYPVSVGILEDGRAYHVALDERSVGALRKRMNQMR